MKYTHIQKKMWRNFCFVSFKKCAAGKYFFWKRKFSMILSPKLKKNTLRILVNKFLNMSVKMLLWLRLVVNSWNAKIHEILLFQQMQVLKLKGFLKEMVTNILAIHEVKLTNVKVTHKNCKWIRKGIWIDRIRRCFFSQFIRKKQTAHKDKGRGKNC